MNLSELSVGDIVYKYEESECSEGWSVSSPVVDKVVSIRMNPFPQYEAFIDFQNSDMVSLHKGKTTILNMFETEEELLICIKEDLKNQMQNIK